MRKEATPTSPPRAPARSGRSSLPAVGPRAGNRSGRTGRLVEAVANDIIAVGGVAETATVAEVAGKSDGIDVMLNAIGF